LTRLHSGGCYRDASVQEASSVDVCAQGWMCLLSNPSSSVRLTFVKFKRQRASATSLNRYNLEFSDHARDSGISRIASSAALGVAFKERNYSKLMNLWPPQKWQGKLCSIAGRFYTTYLQMGRLSPFIPITEVWHVTCK
jgi:hypothetical protein